MFAYDAMFYSNLCLSPCLHRFIERTHFGIKIFNWYSTYGRDGVIHTRSIFTKIQKQNCLPIPLIISQRKLLQKLLYYRSILKSWLDIIEVFGSRFCEIEESFFEISITSMRATPCFLFFSAYNGHMKKELPYPQDPKAFALWLTQQDTLADAQIAGKQGRPLKEYMSSNKNTYA